MKKNNTSKKLVTVNSSESVDSKLSDAYKILFEYAIKEKIKPYYNKNKFYWNIFKPSLNLEFNEDLNKKIELEHLSKKIESSEEKNFNQLEMIHDELKKLQYDQRKEFEILSLNSEKMFSRIESLSAEFHESLIPKSFGINTNDYPIRRFIPIKIYLSEYPGEYITEVITSINKFVESIGFSFVDEFPSKRGSWIKSWFGKSKEIMTHDDFKSRFEKAERALELAALDKVQSEVNKNNAEAASNLLKSLDSSDDAALQVGSMLLVKLTNNGKSAVVLRQLTNNEMILLEKNQSLLSNPSIIIQKLEELTKLPTI